MANHVPTPQSNGASNSTSLQVTKTITAGNQVKATLSSSVSGVTHSMSDSVMGSTGWTKVADATQGIKQTSLWYHANHTGGTNVVFTGGRDGGPGRFAIILHEFSGEDTSAPLENSATGVGTDQTAECGSVAVAASGVVVSGVGGVSSDWNPTFDTDYIGTSNATGRAAQCYRIIAAPITDEPVHPNIGASMDWAAVTGAYKDAAGGGETHNGSAAETQNGAQDSSTGAKQGAGSAGDARTPTAEATTGAKSGAGSAGDANGTPAESAVGVKGGQAIAASSLSSAICSASGTKGALSAAADALAGSNDSAAGSKQASGSATDAHESARSSSFVGIGGAAADNTNTPFDRAEGQKNAAGAGGSSIGAALSHAQGTKGGAHSASDARAGAHDSAAVGSKAAAGAAADLLMLIEAATGFKQSLGSAHDALLAPVSHSTKALPFSRFFVVDRSGSRYEVRNTSASRYRVRQT